MTVTADKGHLASAELPPVTDDFSAFIIAGAVSSDASKFERETEGRTPAQGIQDGVEAERIGFRRVFISERWDLKEADVILAGIGALTTRLELVTGIIVPTTRHPWMPAALGATMHSCFGPRFVLGLGRGDAGAFRGMGIPMTTTKAMVESAKITRRLWAGESVSYTGQLGSFTALAFAETYHGPQPPIWIAGFCHERGAAAAAEAFDGVILPPMLTPDAVADAVQRIRTACERIGRDPAEIRIVAPVVTAPDMDEIETKSISAGRLVTYLQYPLYGDVLATANHWDLETVNRMRNHEQFQNLNRAADLTFHRHEMLGPASVLPWSWITDCSAVGTVSECVTSLQRFIDAGADEVTTYGSTPRQNAALLAAWRQRPQATTSVAAGSRADAS
ncbi:TIGR03857 family LLM class F420-dependent oxidoreductase [Mycobacterium intracellulare]|uniref:TIGR03857 family LLM class F420-dependent oxidoreductase n=1 Tax=Mycobacterium intracellulare TaxID=1767 RepID=UPI001CDAFBB0|nr:TIGR03857 family LLM class F420-dependent oxidoreductase [Mycobacterium intracellulare]MCA2252201.1 TIGR03857 family LLM class F420-dependent oxidoreductase [Mycobacterium intracellulare]UGU03076.1 TIGR03857 family LLM class F420-dependent oxidoreductase [Mycobacterium intracellulare]